MNDRVTVRQGRRNCSRIEQVDGATGLVGNEINGCVVDSVESEQLDDLTAELPCAPLTQIFTG